MKLNKIISGGQKGADLGGLLGARNAGMATGGTAAAGWMTQDGPDPSLQQYGLVQGQAGKSTAQTYFFRTERNVLDSDATVIFGDITSPGSAQTVNLCQRHGKPYLHFSPEQLQQHPRQCVTQLADWLAQQDIAVLNVAGNRERKAPGLQKRVSLIVERAIEQLKEQALGNPAPSPTQPQQSQPQRSPVAKGINIWSQCSDWLGAALTNPTGIAMYRASQGQSGITQHYPIEFRGQRWKDAEAAYQHHKKAVPADSRRNALMSDILVAKLSQYPELVQGISDRGGTAWLEQCSHKVNGGFWEGKGSQSPFLACLINAYEQVLQPTQSTTVEATEPSPTPASSSILRVAWWVSPEASPIPVERCESVLHQARGLAEQWHYPALHLVGDCAHAAEVPIAQAALNLRHQQQQGELPANPAIQIVAPLSTENEQWRSLADHHTAASDLPELVSQLQGSDVLLLVGDAPQIHPQLQMAHAQGQSVLQLLPESSEPLYHPAPRQREQTLEAAEPVAVVESAKAKEQMEL